MFSRSFHSNSTFLWHCGASIPSIFDATFLYFYRKTDELTKLFPYLCWHNVRLSSPCTIFQYSLYFEEDTLHQDASHATSQLNLREALQVFPTGFSNVGTGNRLFCASEYNSPLFRSVACAVFFVGIFCCCLRRGVWGVWLVFGYCFLKKKISFLKL